MDWQTKWGGLKVTLPINRTNLALAQTNQNPSVVASSSANKNTLVTAYDTIDELYNFTTGLISAGTLSRLGIINVKDYNASGDGATTTTGSITTGLKALTVASVSTFAVGQGISVAGAGVAGATLVTTISSISSLVITLADAAGTTVSGAVVSHNETVAFQTAVDLAISYGKTEIVVPYGTYLYGVLTSTSGITFVGDGVTLTGTTTLTLQNLAELSADVATHGINAKYPPSPLVSATGDGTTDDTVALLAIFSYAISNLPCKVYFPKGTYCYTDLGNLAYEGLTIEGSSNRETILKCTNTTVNHNAILMNAFIDDTPSDQFVKGCNVRNIQVQGNTNTDSIFNLQGIVHSHWENVVANSANATTGKSYNFKSVITSIFVRVSTSSALGDNSPVPHTGIYLTEGTRGGVGSGNSTNNTFINCYFETMPVGMHLHLADQNTFIGGAAEACSDTGLHIEQSTNRWNTFIGVAFENNTNYDVYDKGRSSQFINIYTVKLVRLEGEQARLSGGFHGKIEVPGQANVVEDVRVNRDGTDVGGFSDTGGGNYWRNINDGFLAAYVFPLKARAAITVGASPFTWQNTTGNYVQVIAQTGTLTQVLGARSGASNWVLPLTTPNTWIVAPKDSIIISYSDAPGLSYLTLNGF